MNQPQSQVLSLDAPVEGWDAFHSLDAMPPSAAIILDNLIPGPGTVEGRKGYIDYADLLTGQPVETVASYHTIDVSTLVVASNGGVWEIEESGVQGGGAWQQSGTPANIMPAGTFANDRWQTSNFRKTAFPPDQEDGILIMSNGVDDTQIFDGTTMTPMSTTGTDPDDLILLGNPDFIGNVVFKGRVYYWKENDNAFWYTQAGSYQGELQRFDLGAQVQRGGYIKMIVTWTQQDSGDGKDDFIVFIFDTGEILVYQGDDPESAGYWEQVGRYLTGEPMSVRGHSNYGADTIIMTKDGYVGLSTIIQQGRTSDVPAFSRLIHGAVTERTESRGHLYGWDCELYPRRGLFIFNVPLSDSTFEQHVMNTITQKWCRFKGLNFVTFEVNNEVLYGGGQNGKVYRLLEATSDNGLPIQYAAMPAFNYHGSPGNQKHITAVNFISTYAHPNLVEIDGYADFDLPVTVKEIDLPAIYAPSSWSVNPAIPPSPIGSYWDEDYWSGESTPYTTKGWQNVSAYGYAVTILIRFAEGSDTPVWRSLGLRLHMTGAQ
jgi:hypothetical protein